MYNIRTKKIHAMNESIMKLKQNKNEDEFAFRKNKL